jgi:ring-1,2-phenylacetyl-CoA epoxidase subunit PaaA
MIRVCKEESFHQRQGFDIMMKLCAGTPEQKAMAQDALDRWWWPSLMMFGPPDAESVHSAQSARWRIKILSNDELRQRFIDQTVPQADFLGLKVPDPALRWNPESGHYDFGPIDWKEFHEVIKGNGPCNRDRLRTRVRAWEDGAWVREAALAHAEREAARKSKAA